MDARNGNLYPSQEAARQAGVPEQAIVRLEGSEAAVQDVARRLQEVQRLALHGETGRFRGGKGADDGSIRPATSLGVDPKTKRNREKRARRKARRKNQA